MVLLDGKRAPNIDIVLSLFNPEVSKKKYELKIEIQAEKRVFLVVKGANRVVKDEILIVSRVNRVVKEVQYVVKNANPVVKIVNPVVNRSNNVLKRVIPVVDAKPDCR